MIHHHTQQNEEQFQINNFQQEEIVQEKNDISSINSNLRNDDSAIHNGLVNMLEEQKVSEMQEYLHKSEKFQIATQMPMDKFLLLFEAWIEQMKQMEENQLSVDEKEAYLYLKHNLFRILLESLQIYMRKGNTLNLGQQAITILGWSLKNQKNLIDFKDLIFSNESIYKNICKYVEQDFLNNTSSDMKYVQYFQSFWKDYAYSKLREFNNQQPRRPQETNYHKIQQWDQVYYKIAELIMNSDSNPSNILSDIKKQSQYYSDLQGQEKYVLNQYNYANLQQDNYQQLRQEVQLQYNYQPQIQQYQGQQIIQQFNQQNDRLDKADLKSQQQIQQLLYQEQINQKQSDNAILLRKHLQPERLQATILEIPERKRIKKAAQILGELIYKDLRYQILQGIELDMELQNFYNFIDEGKQQSNIFSCDDKCFIQLYGTKAGKKYLINLLDHQFKLSEMLSTSKQEFGIIALEMKKLKKIITTKNSKYRQQQGEED